MVFCRNERNSRKSTKKLINRVSRKQHLVKIYINYNKSSKKAVNKERYLSKEDAVLLNRFINKINEELKDAQN